MDLGQCQTIQRQVGYSFRPKGVGDVEDAARAAQEGVDAVYISNHGGRALDHGRGTIQILPDIVSEVKGKTKIIVDGGIQRGTDIIKAMAIGADMVGIGRLQCVGLGAAGQDGLIRVLEILEEELGIAFSHGCTDLGGYWTGQSGRS